MGSNFSDGVRGARRQLAAPGRWFGWFVVFFALGYWLFVRIITAVDIRTLFSTTAPPSFLLWLFGLFHPLVLLNLLPLLLGWGAAYATALFVVQRLYALPDADAARELLSQFSVTLRLPLRLNEQMLAEDRRESVLLRVGGPGPIVINNGNVVTTELNGRFYRLLGPGLHDLGRFEYIHTLLDLRPQERSASDIQLTTQEGIPVTTDLSLIYRLKTGGEPTKATPFPYDETIIRKAAYTQTVTGAGKPAIWKELPLSMAQGILGSIIAKLNLNDLLQPDNTASEPHLTIKKQLEGLLRSRLQGIGVELLNIRMGQLKLHEQVTEEFIKYWQAYWQKRAQIIRADGAANALEEIEVARAEAEVTMLQTVLEGLQRAQQEVNLNSMSEVFTQYLLENLEKMAWQSRQIHPLPQRLLPQLQELQRLLNPLAEDHAQDEAKP